MMSLAKFAAFLTGIVFFAGYFFLSQLRKEDRELLGWRPLLFGCTLIIGGFLAPNMPVYVGYAALATVLCARSRAEAATLYIVGFLCTPSLSSQLVVGGLWFGTYSASNAIGFAAFLVFLAKPRTGRLSGRRSDLAFGALLFIIWFAQVRAISVSAALRPTLVVIFDLLIPYFVISRSLTTERDLRRWLLAFGMGATCMAVEAIYEARKSWPLFFEMSGHLKANTMQYYQIMMRTRGGFMRAVGSFDEPTSFSVFLAFGWLALLCLRSAFPSRSRHYMVMAVATLGLLASNSRGGLLGAALGTLLIDLYGRRYASLVAKAAAIGSIALLLVFAASSNSRISSVLGTSGDGLGTAQYRQQLFARGMQEFPKAPILGQGIDQVLIDLKDMVQGEGIVDFVNGWLYFLLTTGLVGVLLFALGFTVPATSLIRARRKIIRQPRLLGTASFLFAIPIVYALISFTSGFGGRVGSVFMYLLALTSALLAVGRRGPAGEASPPIQAREEQAPFLREPVPALN